MDRDNIIDYRLNEGNNNRIIRNNNKRRRDHNHNQENYLIEASATTIIKLGGGVITTTGGNGSILLYGILAENEYRRTVNTNIHTNDETLKVTYFIESCRESGEGSKTFM